MPVRLEAALLFVMVKVKLVVPFSGSVAAPKALVMEGGLITVSVADDVDCAPVPAALELIVTLLLKVPSVADETFTVMLHAPTGKLAFENAMLPEPAVAVTVPPQVLVTPGVAATIRPAGSVSVKLASTATGFGLVTANDSVEGASTATLIGLKILVICSGAEIAMLAVTVCWSTVASAEPLPAVPPALNVAVAWALEFKLSG